MESLWQSTEVCAWRRALESYGKVVDRQGVESLPELDAWVRERLPAIITGRNPGHITREELVRVTRWKMMRGVWRGRNLALVRKNEDEAVIQASRTAIEAIPDPRAPIRELSRLGGVGPATASAVAAAAAPEHYPFFDDIVADQVPGLSEVAYTLAYYSRYADALREKAHELGDGWTPAAVERSLWAHAGGKTGVRLHAS